MQAFSLESFHCQITEDHANEKNDYHFSQILAKILFSLKLHPKDEKKPGDHTFFLHVYYKYQPDYGL